MERLLDELREMRSTEQRHVAAVMQDHSLEAVMEALQQVRVTQGSSSELIARRLAPVADCLAEAASSLRGLVAMLVPAELTDHDLSEHIVAEAAAVTRRYGLELEATVELDSAHLHAHARTLLARAVVELVHNACVSSGGRKVWVRASVIGGQAMVRVADEGGGWSGTAGAGTSLGNLAEELYALEGRLESGRGSDEFAVTLSLPIPRRRGGGHGLECA
jgi:signal transduction histidine kinase